MCLIIRNGCFPAEPCADTSIDTIPILILNIDIPAFPNAPIPVSNAAFPTNAIDLIIHSLIVQLTLSLRSSPSSRRSHHRLRRLSSCGADGVDGLRRAQRGPGAGEIEGQLCSKARC